MKAPARRFLCMVQIFGFLSVLQYSGPARAQHLVITRNTNKHIQNIVFPDGEKITYQYRSDGKIASKKFENFQIFSNKPKISAKSSDKNSDYNLAVIKEFSKNFPQIGSIEEILKEVIPDKSENSVKLRFFSAYRSWGMVQLHDLLNDPSYDSSKINDVLEKKYHTLTGVNPTDTPESSYVQFSVLLFKDARKTLRETTKKQIDSKNIRLDQTNSRTTNVYKNISNVIHNIKSCNEVVGNALSSKLSSKMFRFDNEASNYLNGSATPLKPYYIIKVDMAPLLNQNIILSSVLLTFTNAQIGNQYLLNFQKSPEIKNVYFGDASFDVATLNNSNYEWIDFILAHEYGHTLAYQFMKSVLSTRDLELFLMANAKITAQVKNVFPDLIVKLKKLDDTRSKAGETTAQYFAMDALAQCL